LRDGLTGARTALARAIVERNHMTAIEPVGNEQRNVVGDTTATERHGERIVGNAQANHHHSSHFMHPQV
jgi:hypothetical protein